MKFTLMASDYQVRTSIFKRPIRLQPSGVNAEAFHLRTHLNVVCRYWPVIGIIIQKHTDVSLNLCEYNHTFNIPSVSCFNFQDEYRIIVQLIGNKKQSRSGLRGQWVPFHPNLLYIASATI